MGLHLSQLLRVTAGLLRYKHFLTPSNPFKRLFGKCKKNKCIMRNIIRNLPFNVVIVKWVLMKLGIILSI